MITTLDQGIIAFYFLFVLAMGLAFRRLSKNTSDYFRAGGAMPWWITGTSPWIASFSAWTFVGAAGKVYESGTLVLWAFYPAAAALLVVYLFTCVRFRRLRVVTWMEAVRARYGPGTEQFYTWIKVPLSLLLAGVSLNAVVVFMASVFAMPMSRVLLALGSIVTLVALIGRAWAVLASDFVQMFPVTAIALEVNKLRTVGLFQLTNLLAATLLMPMAVPLLYGMFIQRTPAWSAWSTAIVGFLVAYICNYRIDLNHLANFFGWGTPLRSGEIDDFKLGVVTLSTVVIGSLWYFGTIFFFPWASPVHKNRPSRFFANLATPIDVRAEGLVDMDEMIYRMMRSLCLVFGTFVLSLAIIVPNALVGRLCFIFCGGSIFIMGAVLFMRSRVLERQRVDTTGIVRSCCHSRILVATL